MEAVIDALDEQQAELEGLLAALDDAGWATPTRCPGWSVADVVLHLAQSNELVIAGADPDRFAEVFRTFMGGGAAANVDEGAESAVQAERGRPNAELLARWRASVAGQRAHLAACGPADRLPWVIGTLPARTLATTRLSEAWIHTGDVADALGRPLEITDRLWHIARLAWRTLPYAFTRAGQKLSGPVAAELTAPSGAAWTFTPDEPAATVVRGPGADWCLVAARRLPPDESKLVAGGPDAAAVLELLRTYA